MDDWRALIIGGTVLGAAFIIAVAWYNVAELYTGAEMGKVALANGYEQRLASPRFPLWVKIECKKCGSKDLAVASQAEAMK